jgi:hypothetical protein
MVNTVFIIVAVVFDLVYFWWLWQIAPKRPSERVLLWGCLLVSSGLIYAWWRAWALGAVLGLLLNTVLWARAYWKARRRELLRVAMRREEIR